MSTPATAFTKYVAVCAADPMYAQAFVGPLIKLGVDGFALVMVMVLAFTEVPQSFTAYTDNILVA